MSSKNKKFIKKTGTVVPVNSTSSPFAQFPRVVTSSGIISPNPAMTISEGFRHQAEQAELNVQLKAKHADIRAQIIRCISSLPGAPTALVLTGLSSIKLAQHALTWFTAENPHGIFGSEDNVVHVEQLLLELQLSAPSKYQSDAIHRSIDSTLQTLDSVLLAQALSQDKDLHFPALSSTSTNVGNTILQSSNEAQASLKRPREAAPLELVLTKEPRLTQFNLATESVPVDRLPHQRKIKGTTFFGDLIQANSVQKLATSSLGSLLQKSSTSGLATKTKPGRSGPDMRPGMTSFPQQTDFIINPVSTKPNKTTSVVPESPLVTAFVPTPPMVPVAGPSLALTSQSTELQSINNQVAGPSLALTSQTTELKSANNQQSVPASLFLLEDGVADSSHPPLEAGNTSVAHDAANNASPFSSEDDAIIPVSHDNNLMDQSDLDDSLNVSSDDNDDSGSAYSGNHDIDQREETRNPHDPCTVFVTKLHDLHATHHGFQSDLFEKCFSVSIGDTAQHYPPGYDNTPHGRGPLIFDPLIDNSNDPLSFPLSPLNVPPDDSLNVHPDDDMLLSTEDKAYHLSFEARISLLCTNWNTFHSCKSLADIQKLLNDMNGASLPFLLEFYAAYFPNRVNVELTFGELKKNFYTLAHYGHFHYDTFETYSYLTPLAAVTVEFFIIRTVPQWRRYLAWHGVALSDLPFQLMVDQLNLFNAIGPSVQPRLDVSVYILCNVVNYLSSAHGTDLSWKFLRNQLYQTTEFDIDNFHISFWDANLLVQYVFGTTQYPCQSLSDTVGYLLLLRAFQWVHQPHSLASLMQHASTNWIQFFDSILTRPAATSVNPIDDSITACATRLLALHNDTRSILDLYPSLAKDPALVSEYLLAIGAYTRNNLPTCYGLQLSLVASCLVSHLQDEFESINVDQHLSQSDLLFILSAGGIYQGSLGHGRSFASQLFPVYSSSNAFLTIYPQLLATDNLVLIVPPPKSMTENMSSGKWKAYTRKLLDNRTIEHYRQRKLATFRQSPQYRDDFSRSASQYHIDTFHRSSATMDATDCVFTAALRAMTSLRSLTDPASTSRSAQITTTASTLSSTVVPSIPNPVVPTHQFVAPPRRLVPTLSNVSSSRRPIYEETGNFQLPEQQRIVNWDLRSAYVLTNASTYLSLIQLHNTSTRPLQLYDNILFLQPAQHPFQPADPWGTLFLQRQLLYRIVFLRDNVLHCDFVELFCAPADTQLSESDIVSHFSCRYIGTYLMRVKVDSDSQAPQTSGSGPVVTDSAQLPSSVQSTSRSSQLARVFHRGASSTALHSSHTQQRPVSNNVIAIPSSHSADENDNDIDSDTSTDVQVKRVKDSEVHVDGKIYRVQGKTAVYSIIIASTTMCTLMENGQIVKLTSGVGNYVNNYTPEILLKGILRQSVVSATLSGMQLHAPINYAILRFKELVWFDMSELHDKVFYFQWSYPDAWTSTDLHPIHFLSTADAGRKNYQFDYDCWALSWVGLRITLEQILGLSYGPVLQTIISDIQLNNVGQMFDIEYILSLTIRMFALLSQYSSQHVPFKVFDSDISYNPATMVLEDWHAVILLLWKALKSFLTFPLQHEFTIINDKFKVSKMKPQWPTKKPILAAKEKHPQALKPAIKRPSSPVTATASKSRTVTVTPPRKRKEAKVVAFDGDPVRYCIKDFARHYNIVTSLKPCKDNCMYVHYNKLPKNIAKSDVLASVDKLVKQIGLTDAQIQQFRTKIQDDSHFK
jgi:hypothetical protein